MAYSFVPLATIPADDRCEGWIITGSPQFAIVRDDGSLADWPLCDSEADAIADCEAFNRMNDDEWRNELQWCARFAGDMES